MMMQPRWTMVGWMGVMVAATVLAMNVDVASSFFLPSAPVATIHPINRRMTAGTILIASPTPTEGQESDVERLLRRARELRAQAEQDQQQVHAELAEKKAMQDAHTDNLIDHLLLATNGGGSMTFHSKKEIVDRLHTKKVSMDTLEKIVDRLDDRIVMASGQEHVRANVDGGRGKRVDFERVATKPDPAEARRLETMVESLLEAVQVLDDEFRQAKLKAGATGKQTSTSGSLLYSVTHVESEHWGGGQCAQRLRQRLQEKRREREEQFLKRQEEFYEAQRVKKNNPPPPKVKDDHGFL